MAKEATVGVQPYSGSGVQNIRNLEITTVNAATGTQTVVDMQVVCIADESGTLLSLSADAEWQQNVLAELRGIRRGIEQLIGNPFLVEGH